MQIVLDETLTKEPVNIIVDDFQYVLKHVHTSHRQLAGKFEDMRIAIERILVLSDMVYEESGRLAFEFRYGSKFYRWWMRLIHGKFIPLPKPKDALIDATYRIYLDNEEYKDPPYPTCTIYTLNDVCVTVGVTRRHCGMVIVAMYTLRYK